MFIYINLYYFFIINTKNKSFIYIKDLYKNKKIIKNYKNF